MFAILSALALAASVQAIYPPPAAPIYFGANKDYCLSTYGELQDGTAVVASKCNGSAGQKWFINRGSTKVKLGDTGFCLDAGESPRDGTAMKVWTCYDNLPAQQWYFTDDDHIALEGQGQCVDLPSGWLGENSRLQTWSCASNSNQVWQLGPTIMRRTVFAKDA